MSYFSLLSLATLIGISGCLFDYNKNQSQFNKNGTKVENPNDGIGLHQLKNDYISPLEIDNLAEFNENPSKSLLSICWNCIKVSAFNQASCDIDECPKKKPILTKLNILRISAFSPKSKTKEESTKSKTLAECKPKEELTKCENDDKSKEKESTKSQNNDLKTEKECSNKSQNTDKTTEKECSNKSQNTDKTTEKEELLISENCDKEKEQLAKCENSDKSIEKDASSKPMMILENLQKNKLLSNKLQALIERVVKLNHILKTFQPTIANVKTTLCKLQQNGIFLPVMMKRVDNMDSHTNQAQPMLLDMIAALQNLAEDEIKSNKYEIKEIEDHIRAMDEMMQTVTSVSNKLNDLLVKVTGFEKVLSNMAINEGAKKNSTD